MNTKEFKNYMHTQLQRLIKRMRGYVDYYKFPFDVSFPLNEYAESVLYEGSKILESLGIIYYVCDGTILGIVRDNRLIAHDNDIDVAVSDHVDLSRLIAEFEDKKYIVGRKVFFKGEIQQLIFYSKENVIFDICFWQSKADGYYYHYVPEVPKGRRQPDEYFSAPDHVEFRGRNYPTHPNIQKWLQEHYGDDWRIPKKIKGDWRLDVKDIVQ